MRHRESRSKAEPPGGPEQAWVPYGQRRGEVVAKDGADGGKALPGCGAIAEARGMGVGPRRCGATGVRSSGRLVARSGECNGAQIWFFARPDRPTSRTQ